MAIYLEFEQKLKALQDSIDSAKIRNDIPAVEILQAELEKEVKTVFFKFNSLPKITTCSTSRPPLCFRLCSYNYE